MQEAAKLCDKNPSAISKSLKRLELSLSSHLFERVGKTIKLNDVGQRFRVNASKIVAQAKQSIAEYNNDNLTRKYTIIAPSILMFRWASVISKVILSHHQKASISFNTYFEQQAIQQVINGSADLALITENALSQLPDELHYSYLGDLTMQVAAGKNHPIVQKKNAAEVQTTMEKLLKYDFVTPSVSPYNGQESGLGCDGWRNDVFPRKLTIEYNDYSVLGQIVRSGSMLAYLPDYLLRDLDLVRVLVTDCLYSCQEKLLLVSYQQNLINYFKQ